MTASPTPLVAPASRRTIASRPELPFSIRMRVDDRTETIRDTIRRTEVEVDDERLECDK
jgi:hypothetical protein